MQVDAILKTFNWSRVIDCNARMTLEFGYPTRIMKYMRQSK